MSEGYSPIQQTQIDQSNYPQYGITKPDESKKSYFPVEFARQLKYCGNKDVDKTDYLFVSTTGDLKDATFFGKVENYKYSYLPTGGNYKTIYWQGSDEDITNFSVPYSRVVPGNPRLPSFFGVDEPDNTIKFFVERPQNTTCFQSVKKFFTGSGTKRRRKNKRKSSNKKRKQRKSKRRRH
jgi:hypothetical protein